MSREVGTVISFEGSFARISRGESRSRNGDKRGKSSFGSAIFHAWICNSVISCRRSGKIALLTGFLMI